MKIFCKECKRECELITIDEGIGSYEYWGAPGYDSKIFTGSNCCETEVMDEDCDDIVAEDYVDELLNNHKNKRGYNYDRR